jgi:DNA topoisomerase I
VARARLRRSTCSAAGLSRRRRGRGFQYLDADGHAVGVEVRRRIEELAIPPAWTDVWICPDPLGHLQATGFDDAGRKQYLYHERWRARRDRQKYDAMLEFGATLPRLRRRVTRDLRFAPDTLSRERVLACAVRLLDLGFFRVGSEDYARENESYGLTTMLREHVTVDGDELIFDFPAKSGQRRVQAIADHDALRVVAALKRRKSGDQLLAHRDGRHWVDVHADDVNAYIKAAADADFSAKDFRTFHATVLAAVALAAAPPATTKTARRRAIRAAIVTTSEYLGNTPAVCRSAYVDPRIIDRYEAGETIAEALRGAEPDLADGRIRGRIEAAVLELLGNGPAARRAAA